MIEMVCAIAAIVFVVVIALVMWRKSKTWLSFFACGLLLFAAGLTSGALWLSWTGPGKVSLASPDGFGLVIGLVMMIVAMTHREEKAA